MKKNKGFFFLSACYLLFTTCYAVYSYSQIDLNLTLFSNKIYQTFQKSMIQLGYFNRSFSTLIYTLIILILYAVYCILYTSFKKGKLSLKNLWLITALAIGILLFSYPALSHDIFNYIFNAKMVLVYHKNPHINVALEFPHDLWTRFMHNTHTPAPYFYGWTALSLFPSLLGFSKLTLNLLTFKLFEIVFFIWQIDLLNKILNKLLPKERLNRLFLFILNPLILIETFGNGHNDVVMISLALFSLWFLIKEEKTTFKNLIPSIIFLLLSASIKYVTIILLPIYLIYGFKKKIDIGSICAIILFLVIFTRPQDQFHPWYLIWSLSFAAFAKKEWLFSILLYFSLSLMLRYAPLFYIGEYRRQTQNLMSLVTFLPTFLLFIVNFLRKELAKKYVKN